MTKFKWEFNATAVGDPDTYMRLKGEDTLATLPRSVKRKLKESIRWQRKVANNA